MGTQDDDILRALLVQEQRADDVSETQQSTASAAEDAISSSEDLVRAARAALPRRGRGLQSRSPTATPRLRPWSEILEEARMGVPGTVSIADFLTAEEIQAVTDEHTALEAEFQSLHELDAFDWAVSGAAGVLAALVDIFLVQVPQHPGFLGSKAAEGGWLSNLVKEKVGELLPPDRIRALEEQYRVSYDPATSTGLGTPVPGMGPGTHRFQSSAHDPVLGWIIGVRDLLLGEFSAIGKDGRWIVQATGEPLLAGEQLFVRVFEALRLVAGHLLSDVATSRGLPAPLMPLLLFLQSGRIGKQGYTVGEVARQMYRMGYDFRHFLACSLPVLIIEVIVRVGFFAKSIHQGGSLVDAIPMAQVPRLRSQLFMAHSVATAVNAGKVYVTQNPLSVNWAQWLAFFRYLVPQLHWLLIGAERERARFLEQYIDGGWIHIEGDGAALWRKVFGAHDPAAL